jgi:hypothetical protein
MALGLLTQLADERQRWREQIWVGVIDEAHDRGLTSLRRASAEMH